MSENEITKTEGAAIVQPGPAQQVAQLLQTIAQHPDRDPKELVDLYERMLALEAKRQYSEALAAFRAECPPVVRSTPNDQFVVTRNGQRRPRMYADLDDIQSTIDPVLSRHGLSYRWTDMQIDGDMMRVGCILSHKGGHSESASVPVPTESKAGASPQQKLMSAGTYARRYSLIAVTGVRGADMDDDGNATADIDRIELKDQQSIFDAVISLSPSKEKEEATIEKFCRSVGVAGIRDIPKDRLDEAWQKIEAARGAK